MCVKGSAVDNDFYIAGCATCQCVGVTTSTATTTTTTTTTTSTIYSTCQLFKSSVTCLNDPTCIWLSTTCVADPNAPSPITIASTGPTGPTNAPCLNGHFSPSGVEPCNRWRVCPMGYITQQLPSATNDRACYLYVSVENPDAALVRFSVVMVESSGPGVLPLDDRYRNIFVTAVESMFPVIFFLPFFNLFTITPSLHSLHYNPFTINFHYNPIITTIHYNPFAVVFLP